MEHSSNETSANETTQSLDNPTNDSGSPTNHNEPDNQMPVDSPSLRDHSTNTDRPSTSTFPNLATSNDHVFNIGKMPLAGPTSAYYGYPYNNASVVGPSSSKDQNNQEASCSYNMQNLMPADMNAFGLRSMTPSYFPGANFSLNNPNYMNINNMFSNIRPFWNNNIHPEIMYPSFFPNFPLEKSVMDFMAMQNAATFGNGGKSVESCTTTNMQGNINNEKATRNQNPNDDDVTEGDESPHAGDINLREWLGSKGLSASKAVRLNVFKKIVLVVDNAHSRNSALLDLRLSSFMLLENGNINYTGPIEENVLCNDNDKKKRGLEVGSSDCGDIRGKTRKLGEDKFDGDKSYNQFRPGAIDAKNGDDFDIAQLEKKWYAFPEGLKAGDLLSFNIYCLGLLLFELLGRFESMESHSAAMLDLHRRILPSQFLSENPTEAGFCFWLMHPEPSSRPTTSEILESELLYEFDCTSPSEDEGSYDDTVEDEEEEEDDAQGSYDDMSEEEANADLLHYFLVSMQQHKQNKALTLIKKLGLLDLDIKAVEQSHASSSSSDMNAAELPDNSNSKTNVLQEKLFKNIDQLENAYFSVRSHTQPTETPEISRTDKDILKKRENWSCVQTDQTVEEKQVDRVGALFDGICKFARYNKFEVCGTLRNGDILNPNNVISSLSFDRDGEYIAAAVVSKQIKIFELRSLLNDNVDVKYPVLEIMHDSKFSSICWNSYIRNFLASTDYDGLVQMWDAGTGNEFSRYTEHKRRAWSVDFSHVDPTKFATGGDDCTVRLWSTHEKKSLSGLGGTANVCCVQFSAYSSHLLAFGSSNYKIYCYDLRHTRIPWCTLAGHGNAVSYVKFLDSENIVSSSIDGTLKVWDLNKTSLQGLSDNACTLTLTGHKNDKNFIGLSVHDGYIACGSETNEVYAYYRSLPMPITSHEFGYVDPLSGHEITDEAERFVSSVCWRKNSEMLAAGNSNGNIKILRLV